MRICILYVFSFELGSLFQRWLIRRDSYMGVCLIIFSNNKQKSIVFKKDQNRYFKLKTDVNVVVLLNEFLIVHIDLRSH